MAPTKATPKAKAASAITAAKSAGKKQSPKKNKAKPATSKISKVKSAPAKPSPEKSTKPAPEKPTNVKLTRAKPTVTKSSPSKPTLVRPTKVKPSPPKLAVLLPELEGPDSDPAQLRMEAVAEALRGKIQTCGIDVSQVPMVDWFEGMDYIQGKRLDFDFELNTHREREYVSPKYSLDVYLDQFAELRQTVAGSGKAQMKEPSDAARMEKMRAQRMEAVGSLRWDRLVSRGYTGRDNLTDSFLTHLDDPERLLPGGFSGGPSFPTMAECERPADMHPDLWPEKPSRPGEAFLEPSEVFAPHLTLSGASRPAIVSPKWLKWITDPKTVPLDWTPGQPMQPMDWFAYCGHFNGIFKSAQADGKIPPSLGLPKARERNFDVFLKRHPNMVMPWKTKLARIAPIEGYPLEGAKFRRTAAFSQGQLEGWIPQELPDLSDDMIHGEGEHCCRKKTKKDSRPNHLMRISDWQEWVDKNLGSATPMPTLDLTAPTAEKVHEYIISTSLVPTLESEEPKPRKTGKAPLKSS